MTYWSKKQPPPFVAILLTELAIVVQAQQRCTVDLDNGKTADLLCPGYCCSNQSHRFCCNNCYSNVFGTFWCERSSIIFGMLILIVALLLICIITAVLLQFGTQAGWFPDCNCCDKPVPSGTAPTVVTSDVERGDIQEFVGDPFPILLLPPTRLPEPPKYHEEETSEPVRGDPPSFEEAMRERPTMTNLSTSALDQINSHVTAADGSTSSLQEDEPSHHVLRPYRFIKTRPDQCVVHGQITFPRPTTPPPCYRSRKRTKTAKRSRSYDSCYID